MTAPDQEKALADLRAFDSYFQKQLNLIDQLSKLILSSKDGKHLKSSVYPMFNSLFSAGHAIIFLTRSGLMTESYIIARTFLERTVNICYLIASDHEELNDYIEYSLQLVQESLNTRKKMYEIFADVVDIPTLSNVPPVARGKNKYTKVRGKEITGWTTLPLEKRIAFIKSRNAEFNDAGFSAVAGYISEDASEASRGTMYGALFHTGMFHGAQNPEAGENYLIGLRQVMYLLLGGVIEGLLTVASKELQAGNLLSESTTNYHELLQLVGELPAN